MTEERHYRIALSPSRWRACLHVLAALLLATSVMFWRDNAMAHQGVWQGILAFILVIAGVRDMRNSWCSLVQIVSVTESGQLTWLAPDNRAPVQMDVQSRFCPLLVWISWQPDGSQPFNGRRRRLWVFADQLDNRDFRRLCRIVSRCQRQQNSANHND